MYYNKGVLITSLKEVKDMSEFEKIVEQGMLYDFYGELLTAHQKEIYEDLVYNDMSLNEIAAQYGISKQGVHDLIKRCTKTMQTYEDKLHMIARFNAIKGVTNEMISLMNDRNVAPDDDIRTLANRITEELI